MTLINLLKETMWFRNIFVCELYGTCNSGVASVQADICLRESNTTLLKGNSNSPVLKSILVAQLFDLLNDGSNDQGRLGARRKLLGTEVSTEDLHQSIQE